MKKSDRIVGGEFAPANIPWQAQVHMGENSHYADELGPTHFCGATILDAKTILSAAHCFFAGPSEINWYNLAEKYHGKKYIDAMEPFIRVGFTDDGNPGSTMQVGIN